MGTEQRKVQPLGFDAQTRSGLKRELGRTASYQVRTRLHAAKGISLAQCNWPKTVKTKTVPFTVVISRFKTGTLRPTGLSKSVRINKLRGKHRRAQAPSPRDNFAAPF
jgi:hypothetical protein